MALDRYSRLARYWATIGIQHVPPNRWHSWFVLGHPRSGTNWFCRILSHYTGLPIFSPGTVRLVTFGPSVLHMHRFTGVPARTVYTLRDGRDIMVSYYFKVLSTLPRTRPIVEQLAQRCPAPVDREHVRENLPAFIRFLFEENRTSSIPWSAHVREARRQHLLTIRFEDLLENPVPAISSVLEHIDGSPPDPERIRETVAATSFEKRTGRQRGEENQVARSVRKGIRGDWKNHFSLEAARCFDEFAGDALVECGYEVDRSWVDRLAGESRVQPQHD